MLENISFLTLIIISSTFSSDIDQFYKNCQNSKDYGCFTTTDDCISSKNCSFGATWIGTSETEYQFQLISTSGEYVAVGFPSSSSMGPAPVVACSPNFTTPAIYYNTEKYWSAAVMNHSDFVSSYKVAVEDGTTSCEFSMNSTFSVTPSSSNTSMTYDLNQNETFIIMAVGPLIKSTIISHDKKDKTNVMIDLTDHNDFYNKNDTNHNETGGAIYDKCYQDKGCFGYPDNCVSKRNCDIMVTYTKVTGVKHDDDADDHKFKFEIGGKVGNDYTAVGLSLDNKMGEDSVMACINSPTHHNVTVSMYWNLDNYAGSDPLADTTFGLSHFSSSVEDGFYTCTFYRETVTNISIPQEAGNGSVVFDLDHTKYFLLLAMGPVDNKERLKFHSAWGRTGEAVDLGDFSQVSGDKGTIIKLHASFMVLAWLACANVGTFVARYCKDIFQVLH